MATAYGSTVSHWRSYVDYSTSDTATTTTITAEGGFGSIAWGFNLQSNMVATSMTCNGTTVSNTGNVYTAYGTTTNIQIASGSWAITRTTAEQTITLSFETVNTSGYENGTSTGSVGIIVPSLESFKINYDGNGGSGCPSSQTKYYGIALTISSTVPTRSGYNFLGWATSSTGSVQYQPGGTIAANTNQAMTLYAVWEVSYIAPTISSFSARRCDSSGNNSDSGTYAKINATWAVNNGTNATQLRIQYRLSSATSWTNGYTNDSPNAKSGTITNEIIGNNRLDADSTYIIRFTVTDSGGSAYTQTTLSAQFYVIDFGNKGKSIGMGCAASDTETGLDIAMATRFSSTFQEVFPNITLSVTPTANQNSRGYYLCDSAGTVYGNFRGRYETDGAIYSELLAQRTVSNTTYYCGMRFGLDTKGNQVVTLPGSENTALAICSALGALKPQTLYNNGDGTTGSVTLSSSAANFSRLEIYTLNNGVYSSQTVYEPNGATVELSMQYRDSSDSGKCWIITRLVRISGTSISNVRAATYYIGTSNGLQTTDVELLITKVIGFA